MSFTENLWWGARKGFSLAAKLCALATVIYLVAAIGAEAFDLRFLLALIGLYLLGGLLGGAIIGALRPFLQLLAFSLLAGGLGTFPFFYASTILFNAYPPSGQPLQPAEQLPVALFCSVLAGGYSGWAFWQKRREEVALRTEGD